jgi:hypothetical protein
MGILCIYPYPQGTPLTFNHWKPFSGVVGLGGREHGETPKGPVIKQLHSEAVAMTYDDHDNLMTVELPKEDWGWIAGILDGVSRVRRRQENTRQRAREIREEILTQCEFERREGFGS